MKKAVFILMALLPFLLLVLAWGKQQGIPGWIQMAIAITIGIFTMVLTNFLFWKRLVRYVNMRMDKFDESLFLHTQECPVKKEVLMKSSIVVDDIANNSEAFRRLFQANEPAFLFKLRELIPGITPTEELLCICIRMGLSTNEIATRMSISKNSVHTFRYRFKRKAQLADNESLDDWISHIE